MNMETNPSAQTVRGMRVDWRFDAAAMSQTLALLICAHAVNRPRISARERLAHSAQDSRVGRQSAPGRLILYRSAMPVKSTRPISSDGKGHRVTTYCFAKTQKQKMRSTEKRRPNGSQRNRRKRLQTRNPTVLGTTERVIPHCRRQVPVTSRKGS
jgi:hypothetical protein